MGVTHHFRPLFGGYFTPLFTPYLPPMCPPLLSLFPQERAVSAPPPRPATAPNPCGVSVSGLGWAPCGRPKGSLRSPRVRPRRTRRAPAIAAAPRRTPEGLDTPRGAATRDHEINSHSILCTLQAAHKDRSKVGTAARKSAKNCELHRSLTLALSSCFSAPAKQFQTP